MTTDQHTFLLGGDLAVNRLGFGAMRLTDWQPPADPTHSIAVARRAVELGVTFIDTADSYALGANEELLADALHPYPDDLVIATKAGQSRPSPTEWKPLGRPEYLHQQAELSLRRLRIDHIALFQLHRIDPQVPSPTRSARSSTYGTLARSATSDCPKSPSHSWKRPGPSSRSPACRTSTT